MNDKVERCTYQSLEYVISGEKTPVLTKFCSLFHCFIAFNVMEFDAYVVVFTFGTISLLP